MKDIVMPDGNEEDFLEMADKLGWDELIFLYDKKPKTMPKEGKTAFLADSAKEVGKNQSKYDFILAPGQKWAFNDKRVDAILGLEGGKRKDFPHHRASGLNQVLAKQAKDNKTIIAFNYGQLYDQEQRDIVLGRMMQNVNLCRKYDVEMRIATFAIDPYEMRTPKDLQAFGETIGMHAKTAKKALDW